MEKFMYVSPYMRITQGYMMGSHVSSYAIDDGGSDTGKDFIIAPYSGTVKQIYPQYENEVFYESDEPVQFADGTIDYGMTMFLHQDSPMAYGMAVGKHYNQGDKIYIEGGRYKGQNGVFATHLHVEFGRGKYQGWYKNESGYYSLVNAKKPEDCCFIDDSYHILYDYGYHFKKVTEYKTGVYKCLYNMKVRSGAGLEHKQVKVCDLTADGKAHATSQSPNAGAVYKEGTLFTAKTIIKNDTNNSVWAKSPSGYICLEDSKQVYCSFVE